MRQVTSTGALLALATFFVAGCVDVAVNKGWRRCKEDPCSEKCEEDLRQQYCDFYDDSKCDRCWSRSDSSVQGDSGRDAAVDAEVRDGSDTGTHTDAELMECTRNLDCSAAAPRCASGECGLCKSDADCSGRSDAPACHPLTGACVLCTAAKPDLCVTAGKICKEGGGECVGCNTNDDCSEAAPHCDSNNECGVCIVDADCAKYGKVCDGGECVQCTGKKAEWCNGTVCDSKARTCAIEVLPQTADLCEACISDAQCGKSRPALCLPTSFGGRDLGYFCQPMLAAGESCIGDHRPYAADALDLQNQRIRSIDGATDASCKLALTTCAALADFRNKQCGGLDSDLVCGVTGLDDGVCRPVQTVYRCSIPCLSDADCKPGSTCGGSGACSF